MEKLIYGTDRGAIVVRSLPYFDQFREYNVTSGYQVLTLLSSPDSRFLLVGSTNGGFRILTDPTIQPAVEKNLGFTNPVYDQAHY